MLRGFGEPARCFEKATVRSVTRATAKKKILLVGSGSKHYLTPLRRNGCMVEGLFAADEAALSAARRCLT
jgi:hypothetical protein